MELLVFLGSARDSTPPCSVRLGLRVSRMVHRLLTAHGHRLHLVDPLDLDMQGVFKPHFAYAEGRAPESLDDMAETIAAADGYVMVGPEYNHAMSPALAHVLNHFGASRFLLETQRHCHLFGRPMGGRAGSADRPQPGSGIYDISKAATARLMRQMANDFDDEGDPDAPSVESFSPASLKPKACAHISALLKSRARSFRSRAL